MESLTLINWVAIYAAIVSTLALLNSVYRVYYISGTNKVKLNIDYEKHPDYKKHFAETIQEYDPQTGRGGSPTVAYVVTVRNIGNIEAFIENVYGVSSDNKKHEASVNMPPPRSGVLHRVSGSEIEGISAKSSKKFYIYFSKSKQPLELNACYVVDKTGKRWKAKMI